MLDYSLSTGQCFSNSNATSCSEFNGCSTCVESENCLWCESTQTCLPSNMYVANFPYGQCMEYIQDKASCSGKILHFWFMKKKNPGKKYLLNIGQFRDTVFWNLVNISREFWTFYNWFLLTKVNFLNFLNFFSISQLQNVSSNTVAETVYNCHSVDGVNRPTNAPQVEMKDLLMDSVRKTIGCSQSVQVCLSFWGKLLSLSTLWLLTKCLLYSELKEARQYRKLV